MRRVIWKVMVVLLVGTPALGDYTRNIMLTGYWPPTSQMLVPFSTDASLNPSGWLGQNWENKGYDVYSFFPVGATTGTAGTGDFTVDYQDTLADFQRITAQLHPVAILSFGQTGSSAPWVLEYNAVNWASWTNDYQAPYQPTPLPPDGSEPVGYYRHSTLPIADIVSSINGAQISGLRAVADTTGNPGTFLCNYLAYQEEWYQNLHSDPSDPYQCIAAGFTHVGQYVTLSQGTAALDVELRTTLDHLPAAPEPSTLVLVATAFIGLLVCAWRRNR
jgi:pyrrolidone-carboxylate peptidase